MTNDDPLYQLAGVQELPITAPPVLWSDTHNITALFTWQETAKGWEISNGPFERLTHYTVGGTMTADGPMILRHNIEPELIAGALRAAQRGEDFIALLPNVYRRRVAS